ncbi:MULTISPECIES: gas vesicle protein GvpO [Polymorphospora]|uniref:Gas vesicle protein GvpO n=1 Tax=Polymorphospora lycopeni TaxID=3140240 RepID=A0ABV5CSR2_9ACTN
MPTSKADRSATRRSRGERYRDEADDDRLRHEQDGDGPAYDDDDADPDDTDLDDTDRDDTGRRESRSGLPASRAARAGLEYVAELTGKAPIGITSLERGESGWTVGVEVVEDRRVPSSGDILAVYVADLDDDGELLGYRRVRRYARGRGDTGGDR